ncbi:MAG TPA: NmrA/HSCARG family protein [Anaerolineaceae bacterium]|nr:NmrA/HSCARG family protein [Anaerolineaceae bacterium]
MDTNSNERIVAVMGAAGQQGGAVARRLLANGWGVRALTREVNKPAAQALAQAGARVVAADNDDRFSLERAFQGAYGVFSVQNYWLPGVGKQGEIRQGKNAADAAKAAGVRHFVYSSVGAAHRGMGQLHFESKWEIEQYVQSLGLPYTILRPVAFMENYNWQRAAITNGFFSGMGLSPDKKTQIVAVEDIAAFVALALAHPEDFLGKTIELAGDELTEPQIAETLSRVIGRPVQLARRSAPEGAAPDPEMVAMYNFFNGKGYDADIPTLRRLYPGLHTFEQWLRLSTYENAQPEPMPPAGSRWG